eukprot:146462-Amphidinium_carterae.1
MLIDQPLVMILGRMVLIAINWRISRLGCQSCFLNGRKPVLTSAEEVNLSAMLSCLDVHWHPTLRAMRWSSTVPAELDHPVCLRVELSSVRHTYIQWWSQMLCTIAGNATRLTMSRSVS